MYENRLVKILLANVCMFQLKTSLHYVLRNNLECRQVCYLVSFYFFICTREVIFSNNDGDDILMIESHMALTHGTLTGAIDRLFRDNQANTIAADNLTPCSARSSMCMLLVTWTKMLLVF